MSKINITINRDMIEFRCEAHFFSLAPLVYLEKKENKEIVKAVGEKIFYQLM